MTKTQLLKELQKQITKYSVHCEGKHVITISKVEESIEKVVEVLNATYNIKNIEKLDIFSYGDINKTYKWFEITHDIDIKIKGIIATINCMVYDLKFEKEYRDFMEE